MGVVAEELFDASDSEESSGELSTASGSSSSEINCERRREPQQVGGLSSGLGSEVQGELLVAPYGDDLMAVPLQGVVKTMLSRLSQKAEKDPCPQAVRAVSPAVIPLSLHKERTDGM